MSNKPIQLQTAQLLQAIGTVQAPAQRVLQTAREALWSAVASEMLDLGATGKPATAETQGRDSATARRRQASRPRNERKMSIDRRSPEV